MRKRIKKRRRQTRADFDAKNGVTYAKRFPAFVFGTTGNGVLVHRVAKLALWWYDSDRQRHNAPLRAIAECACGQSFHVPGSQLTDTPNPKALHCGRCAGRGPLFGKKFRALPVDRRTLRAATREAHARLVGKE